MRKIPFAVPGLFCCVVLASTGCALSPNIPGSALGSEKLKGETAERIKLMDKAAAPECSSRKVINTELPGTFIAPGMGWEEEWYLDRCGTAVPYNVRYRVINNVVQFASATPYRIDSFSRIEYLVGLAERNQCSPIEPPAQVAATPTIETYAVKCEEREIEFECKFPKPLTWQKVQRANPCWRTK